MSAHLPQPIIDYFPTVACVAAIVCLFAGMCGYVTNPHSGEQILASGILGAALCLGAVFLSPVLLG